MNEWIKVALFSYANDLHTQVSYLYLRLSLVLRGVVLWFYIELMLQALICGQFAFDKALQLTYILFKFRKVYMVELCIG